MSFRPSTSLLSRACKLPVRRLFLSDKAQFRSSRRVISSESGSAPPTDEPGSSETVKPSSQGQSDDGDDNSFNVEELDAMKKMVDDFGSEEDDREMVDMWNKKGPSGPEWGGPRGYEPTRHGDWARNGRVSDF